MTLYRAVRLGEFDDPILKTIGKHWTLDYDKAFPYGGKGTQEFYYIYATNVEFSMIDLDKTYDALNGDFSYEKEIVLKEGIEITVNRIDKIYKTIVNKNDNGWIFTNKTERQNINFKCKI